jgi:CheY-like chemotaxis protein
MSPQEARVSLIEDDSDEQELLKKYLERCGHTVVLSANSLPEALSAVKRFNELKVDVAVIDGNLNEEDTSGNDGQEVLRAIREQAPQVRTIGFSASKMDGVDIYLGKQNGSSIGQVVSDLK